MPGGWLIVTCRLTTCTPGSALGPTLGNEYGKSFSFFMFGVLENVHKCSVILISQWYSSACMYCLPCSCLHTRNSQCLTDIPLKLYAGSHNSCLVYVLQTLPVTLYLLSNCFSHYLNIVYSFILSSKRYIDACGSCFAGQIISCGCWHVVCLLSVLW